MEGFVVCVFRCTWRGDNLSGFTEQCQSPPSLDGGTYCRTPDQPQTDACPTVPVRESGPGSGLGRLPLGSGPLLRLPGTCRPRRSCWLTHILGFSQTWSCELGRVSLPQAFVSERLPPGPGQVGPGSHLAVWRSVSWGESWSRSSPSFIQKLFISKASPGNLLCFKHFLCCDFSIVI